MFNKLINDDTDAANTQCKSPKSIVNSHGPQTYIILNPDVVFSCDLFTLYIFQINNN